MRRSAMIAIPAALALSACGGGGGKHGNGLSRGETLLQIAASGESETKPDQAIFTVGVSSIAVSSEAATKANNDKMNAVVAGLEKLGIAKDDIQTQQLTVGRIDYGNNRGKFEAQNTVTVKVRKVENAGAAIAAATSAGANVLSGPTLTVSDPEKAKLSAYSNAYKAARARADAYAEAAGLKVSRVLAIRDGGQMSPPPVYGYADATTEQAAVAPMPVNVPPPPPPPPIMPGTTTHNVGVSVDFALVEK